VLYQKVLVVVVVVAPPVVQAQEAQLFQMARARLSTVLMPRNAMSGLQEEAA